MDVKANMQNLQETFWQQLAGRLVQSQHAAQGSGALVLGVAEPALRNHAFTWSTKNKKNKQTKCQTLEL